MAIACESIIFCFSSKKNTHYRDIDEIALEVAEKALEEWGKAEGEVHYLKRAPESRYEIWKKRGVLPRNIDREIVEIMHRTHIGVDQARERIMVDMADRRELETA